MDLGALSIESFAPHVGTIFTVQSGETSVEMTLLEVRDYSRLMEGAVLPDGTAIYKRVPFSLTFSGPREPQLEGAMYGVGHSEMEIMEIFLKPFAQGEESIFYEAVFN